MVFLFVNWRIWAVVGLLFAYGLARRALRSWLYQRRQRREAASGG